MIPLLCFGAQSARAVRPHCQPTFLSRASEYLGHLIPRSRTENMEAEPVLSSSQESIGKLFRSNLPSNCYGLFQECGDFSADGTDYFDSELAEAEQQAMESGSITPLVKQELKLMIQTRRLSEGKDELKVGFVQPSSHQVKMARYSCHSQQSFKVLVRKRNGKLACNRQWTNEWRRRVRNLNDWWREWKVVVVACLFAGKIKKKSFALIRMNMVIKISSPVKFFSDTT